MKTIIKEHFQEKKFYIGRKKSMEIKITEVSEEKKNSQEHKCFETNY